MKKIILLVLVLSSCTNTDGTRQFLQENGYSNIEITGYDFFAKSQTDLTSTGFTARNLQGQLVTGAVTEKSFLDVFKPKFSLKIWRTE